MVPLSSQSAQVATCEANFAVRKLKSGTLRSKHMLYAGSKFLHGLRDAGRHLRLLWLGTLEWVGRNRAAGTEKKGNPCGKLSTVLHKHWTLS